MIQIDHGSFDLRTNRAGQRVPIDWKTGEPLGSITNTPKFIQNNMAFVTKKLFKEEFNMAENEWFWLPNVKRMIDRLFHEACRGGYGKWQWWNFYMEDWELKKYSHIALRAYVVGGQAHPWFD